MDRKIEKKKITSSRIAGVAVILIIFIFAIYTFFLRDSSSVYKIEKERVTISTVREGVFREYTPVTGRIEPIETFFLDVSDGGRVVEKYVDEGEILHIGDPIIKLDNPELTLNIIYNEANVFQQINNLRSTRLQFEMQTLNLKNQLFELEYESKNYRRDFETDRELYKKNLISKIAFERSRDRNELGIKKLELARKTFEQDTTLSREQINQLEKSVNQLQANLKITKRQLENLTGRAPINGQLTALNAEIGESISRGQNLGRIDNVDSFKVTAGIDELYIARIKAGQMAEFKLNGKSYQLKIKTVYPQVKDGKFNVDLIFSGSAPSGIRRGQSLQLRIELSDRKKALLVDRGGFFQSTGGRWIYALDPTGTIAVKQEIELGMKNPKAFEVISGLKEGDIVIVSSYEDFGGAEKIVFK